MRYYPGIMLGLQIYMGDDGHSTVDIHDNEHYGRFTIKFNEQEQYAAIDTFKRAKDILDDCRTKLVALGFEFEEGEFWRW